MINTILISWAGLLAGALHVLMGPDHWMAVAPLALQQKTKSHSLGVRWGLGHASGVLLIGLLAVLLKESISTSILSSHFEKCVGVMLIVIGLWGMQRSTQNKLHLHVHAHTHTALGVGIIHGLAGGSHFLGVLPALAMPTQTLTDLYLIFFGLGTIGAMTTFTVLIGQSGKTLKNYVPQYFGPTLRLVSVAALILGGYWLGLSP